MWTTRCWKVAVMCGWLAAPMAMAKPTALGEPPRQAVTLPEVDDLYPGAPDDMALPRLRHVESVACAAAPEGRLWVADTEECGETECIQKMTVWVGSWTVEDAEVTVECDAEHIVLATHDWRMVLIPDGKGDFDVEESTLAEAKEPPSAHVAADGTTVAPAAGG